MRRDPQIRLCLSIFLCCTAILLISAGCAAARERPARVAAAVTLVELNPVLSPGRTAVLPAALAAASDASTALPPSEMTVSLDGRAQATRLYWAWTQTPGAAARAAWLEPPQRWHLTLDPPAGGAFAVPMIVFEVPPRPEAEWLEVGGQRLRPIWLRAEGSLWQRDLLDPRDASLALLAAVQPEAEDPARCWRAALMADRLHTPDYRPHFSDSLVQALAWQQVDRWQAALDRLAAADLALARELRRRLTRVCRDGDTLVPAWPTDPVQLADLLQILLSPAHDEVERAVLTRAWLVAQPRVLAWQETTGRRDRIALGLANLTEQPLAVRLRWRGTYEAPRTVTLEAERVQRLELTPPPDLPARETVQVLYVEAGERVHELTYPAAAVEARPPGLLIGPFLQPRTLRSWRAGTVNVEPAGAETRASLRRTDAGWELFIECRIVREGREVEPGRAAAGLGAAGGAVSGTGVQRPGREEEAPARQRSAPGRVVPAGAPGGSPVEWTTRGSETPRADGRSAAAAPPRAPGETGLHDPAHLRTQDLVGEAVYLFVGAVDEPTAVLALAPTGEIEVFHGSLPAGSIDVRGPRIGQRREGTGAEAYASGRWSATIRIPPTWIGEGDLLALGLLRSFSAPAGPPPAPTSFPQPAFPWRLDPGRLIIDLSQWDELAGANPL